jgi:hypothetical protein
VEVQAANVQVERAADAIARLKFIVVEAVVEAPTRDEERRVVPFVYFVGTCDVITDISDVVAQAGSGRAKPESHFAWQAGARDLHLPVVASNCHGLVASNQYVFWAKVVVCFVRVRGPSFQAIVADARREAGAIRVVLVKLAWETAVQRIATFSVVLTKRVVFAVGCTGSVVPQLFDIVLNADVFSASKFDQTSRLDLAACCPVPP